MTPIIITNKILLDRRYDELLSFSQVSLGWPYSELFFFDISLWNQYKYIAFNIFSCRILIVLHKTIIIVGISNETKNKLILCRNATIFYGQELGLYFKCRKSKWNFSSSCFIADDSHAKIVWLHVVVFTEREIFEIILIY